MRGLASIGALGIAACTATNPAYQAEDGSGEGDPDGGTAAETTAAETTAAETTAAETTASGESSGAEMTCELHTPRPLRIRLYEGGELVEPPCLGGPPIMQLPPGNSAFEDNVIIHPECVNEDMQCLCTGLERRIEIEGLEEFPGGVPSCGQITLWWAEGPRGCEWGGIMMQGEDGIAPVFIAARTRIVPPLGPKFELGLVREPDEEDFAGCRGDCEPHAPGRYQLDVVGQVIAADGLSHFVEVAFLPGAPLLYAFENLMSSVTETCEEEVAWLTVLD